MPRKPLCRFAALALAALVAVAAAARPEADAPAQGPVQAEPGDWIQLFNGRDLSGWVPKFTKYELGENPYNTVRVEDGLLRIRYDDWPTFDGEFGHIFYVERPFSYYVLAAEYRFVDEQVAGGPDWAVRNNGLMLHSPHPKTMLRDQDFPISIEVQLLGGYGKGPRSTANLCTPGSHVVMKGRLEKAHCINSSSATYEGDQWVRVEVEVHGDELVRHWVDGRPVLEYTRPQMGGGAVAPVDPAVKVDGMPMASGYISIQAETAPTDFRKIELLDLEGCMDPDSPNYRSYYVKPKPGACAP